MSARTMRLINARNDHLRGFEGRRVSLSLVGGSRIDDCQMVSAARGPTESLWACSNGVDRSVPVSEVVDHWEVPPDGGRAA
jgi:hypothetical protein